MVLNSGYIIILKVEPKKLPVGCVGTKRFSVKIKIRNVWDCYNILSVSREKEMTRG